MVPEGNLGNLPGILPVFVALVQFQTGNFPDAELSVVDGGQPVYYYMISVE